jgi:sensor histidine kinase regulating citrate/malate metabolism
VHDWVKHFPAAITVTDRNAVVTEMNDKACETFAADGGANLIGHSLWDCHQPESIARIKHMLATGENNVYTIDKQGRKKLIFQQPYFENGEVAGLVEISLELPPNLPNHARD